MVIDINMDEGMLDGLAAMTKFLRIAATEPDVAKVPFMIDSVSWSVVPVTACLISLLLRPPPRAPSRFLLLSFPTVQV